MPTREELKAIVDTFKRRADYEFFFDNLESPDWLVHLDAEGHFDKPDEPKYQGDTVSFPIWPPAKYLIKVADQRPREVLEIINRTKTDNVRVHGDFAEAAIRMPAKEASKIVPLVGRWLDSPYKLALWERVAKLLSKLAEEGEVNAAMRLADALLDVKADSSKKGLGLNDNIAVSRLRGDWEYKKIIDDYFVKLVDSTGAEAIFLLCDKLQKVLDIEERGHPESFGDLSAIWRGSIEESNQNHPFGLKDTLITGIRDSANHLVEASPDKLSKLVENLRQRKMAVFSRLALYLTNKHSKDVSMPRKLMFDDILFGSSDVWHEYALLIHDWFSKLSGEDKSAFLNKIDVKVSQKNRKREAEEPIDRDDRLARYYYLTMIRADLTGESKKQLEAYKDEFGELDHPTFRSYMSFGWVGPQSPKSKEELSDLLLPELAEFLREWEPKKGEFGRGPSMEGLGREIEGVVVTHAVEFSNNLHLFRNLDRTLIRAIIRGIAQAVETNSKDGGLSDKFNWKSVLGYCLWASTQSDNGEEKNCDHEDRDPNWSWTRQQVARLLLSGFQSDNIPINQRKLAWKALEPCFADRDPTPESEEKYLSNEDYYQRAINCTRSTALEALIMYGLWVVRALSLQGRNRNFSHYTEIKTTLEYHLNTEFEPSLAVRSIYGRWLPWIFVLDENWSIENLERIFPEQSGLEKYYDAAWLTYIKFCSPYENVFNRTRKYYLKMLDRMESSSEKRPAYGTPENRYIDHLMAFYWRGAVTLDEELMKRFFDMSALEPKKTAINFIGRSLKAMKKPLDGDTKQRLLSLMNFRFNELKKKDSKEERIELAEFGWWLSSGQFEVEWSLEKMTETLKSCGYISPDHLVMTFLNDNVRTYPRLVVECLEQIIKHATKRQGFYGWIPGTRNILIEAMASESSQAKDKAINLVHFLVAKGQQDFDQLLQT